MKQYVVDELRPGDYDRLKEYLNENLEFTGFDDLYRIPIDEAMLTSTQASHNHCKPLYFTLILTPESLTCELLVRTGTRIKCNCMGYATISQRNWVVEWVDNVFRELDIIA